MEKNIVYLECSSDKNLNIQLWSDDNNLIEYLNKIFYSIQGSNDSKNFDVYNCKMYQKFYDLKLFRQGYNPDWIMLESWSNGTNLMIEFLEFCGKEMNLKIDII